MTSPSSRSSTAGPGTALSTRCSAAGAAAAAASRPTCTTRGWPRCPRGGANYSNTAAMNSTNTSASNATVTTVGSSYALRTVTDQLALHLAAKQSGPDVDQKIATAVLDWPSTTDLTAAVNLKTTPANVDQKIATALLGGHAGSLVRGPGPAAVTAASVWAWCNGLWSTAATAAQIAASIFGPWRCRRPAPRRSPRLAAPPSRRAPGQSRVKFEVLQEEVPGDLARPGLGVDQVAASAGGQGRQLGDGALNPRP